MKLPGIAVATLAITALVGGTAVAQVTMQPIPNPPEKARAMKGGKRHHHHMHMHKHVHMHKHMHMHYHHHAAKTEAAPAAAEAPPPAQPQ
ncbi:MAG TPA: hypothetical protein VGG68_03495 [Caulobacteraceae bacterium]|jgi:hypothetical protein